MSERNLYINGMVLPVLYIRKGSKARVKLDPPQFSIDDELHVSAETTLETITGLTEILGGGGVEARLNKRKGMACLISVVFGRKTRAKFLWRPGPSK